jgi:hypothetical protein
MTNRPKLFDDTETLPLFSGTAQRKQAPAPFTPEPDQPSLPFACAACRDTGRISTKPISAVQPITPPATFCWCKAGQAARRAKTGSYITFTEPVPTDRKEQTR